MSLSFQPFRFWCQKVLPAVYDDSLSYYELLCKMVIELNKVMQETEKAFNELEQNVMDYQSATTAEVQRFETDMTNKYNELMAVWKQLQDWVSNYFNNLDVQEEINNKLDAMVADGTIDKIFTRLYRIASATALGMDNTGTINCSPIIEEALKNYDAIYFEKGLYLIDSLENNELFYGIGQFSYNGNTIPCGDIRTTTIYKVALNENLMAINEYLLNRKIIAATWIFSFGEGTYNYADNIAINHQNGERIQYVGSGSANTKLLFTFVNQEGTRTGAFSLNGSYNIGLINAMTIDGNNWSSRTGGSPETAQGNANDPQGIIARNGAHITLGTDVIVRYFARCGIFAYNGSYINADKAITEYNGSDGIVASHSSTVNFNNGIARYNYGHGVYADYASSIWCSNATTTNGQKRGGTSNSVGIGAYSKSSIYCQASIIQDCDLGLSSEDGFIDCSRGSIINSTTMARGISCLYNATIKMSNNIDNATYGVYVSSNACVYIANCTIRNCNQGLFVTNGANAILSKVSFRTITEDSIYIQANSCASLDTINIIGGKNGIVATGSTAFSTNIGSITGCTEIGIQARFGAILNFSQSATTGVTGNQMNFSPNIDTTTGIAQSAIFGLAST